MVYDFMVRIYGRVIHRLVTDGADLETEVSKLPEEYRDPVKSYILTLS